MIDCEHVPLIDGVCLCGEVKAKYAYTCDGCGKWHGFASLDDPPPAGWLETGKAWRLPPITACSADCVAAAIRAVRRKHEHRAIETSRRISAAKLEPIT